MQENMVRINLEDPDGKVFDTIDIPESYMDKINKICEEENITFDEFFSRALNNLSLEIERLELLEKYKKSLEQVRQAESETIMVLEQIVKNLEKQKEIINQY